MNLREIAKQLHAVAKQIGYGVNVWVRVETEHLPELREKVVFQVEWPDDFRMRAEYFWGELKDDENYWSNLVEQAKRKYEQRSIFEFAKNQVWTHMLALPKTQRPRSITDKSLERAKALVWNDDDFWQDIILRHGLKDITPQQLAKKDPQTYEHMVSNFWGMLTQTLHESSLSR